MTRVCIDADRCVGHARCYTLAQDVFDADEVGHCIVRAEEVSGKAEEHATLMAASVSACPQ